MKRPRRAARLRRYAALIVTPAVLLATVSAGGVAAAAEESDVPTSVTEPTDETPADPNPAAEPGPEAEPEPLPEPEPEPTPVDEEDDDADKDHDHDHEKHHHKKHHHKHQDDGFPHGSRDINCRKVKCVALTFDDGPGAQTRRLLGMLDDAHARATFFPVGQVVAAHPQSLRRIDKAGHEIGNHSWSHALLPSLTDAAIASQITRTADVIKRVTGERPTLVRPPYGAQTSRVSSILRRLDAPSILWTVDPLDWKYRNSTTVHRNVMNQVRPGAVVLLHDIHGTTVSAVPAILRDLKRAGYTFVTVSELYDDDLDGGRTYTGRAKGYYRH